MPGRATSTCHDQSMTPARRTAWSAVLLAVALTASACGSTSLLGSGHSSTSLAHRPAVLTITHDPRIAARADRIVAVREGRLTAGDETEDFYAPTGSV